MMAAETSSRQVLATDVTTADAPSRSSESDLFSPRSTAALALSSFAAQAVVEQQQQPSLHHRPAALFGNDANDDYGGNSRSKPLVVPPAKVELCKAESVVPRKKPNTSISTRTLEKKSAATQKSLTTRNKNTAKAEMKKRGINDRARISSSFPSSVSLQYPAQNHYRNHNYIMHHQQQQYAMLPVQFLPGYAVHHRDFYPPGATTVPWTPHCGNDSLTGSTIVYPPHGPSPASSSIVSSQRPSPSPPPPLVLHRGPSPSGSTNGRPSPTFATTIPEPSPKGVRPVRMSGPSSGILHQRPSPPLRAPPPTFDMMPHPHHHHHFHRPPSITWHYPPAYDRRHQSVDYFVAPSPSVPHAASSAPPCHVTTPSALPAENNSASSVETPSAPPLKAEAEHGGEVNLLSSTVTPTSADKKLKKTTIMANDTAAQDVELADAMIFISDSKKKKGEPGYQRKKNSLGLLAESFVAAFPSKPLGLTGEELVIDALASNLNVERRRIYDVVNILEALQLVVKRGKNTYHWMGNSHLPSQFAILQNEAIEMWPEAACKNGLVEKMSTAGVVSKASNGNKSLTKLSQLFMQVFLVGFDTVSLPQASDIIQGYVSTKEKLAELGCGRNQAVPVDPVQLQVAAARGLKTKIRRLYDIANVFLSVGLLVRVDRKEDNVHRRPHYRWNYSESVQNIRFQVWPSLTEEQTKTLVPFDDVQTTAMLNIGLNPRQYVQQQLQLCKDNQSSLEANDTLEVKRPVDELSLLSHDDSAPKRRKQNDIIKQRPPSSPDKHCARRVSLPASGEGKQKV